MEDMDSDNNNATVMQMCKNMKLKMMTLRSCGCKDSVFTAPVNILARVTARFLVIMMLCHLFSTHTKKFVQGYSTKHNSHFVQRCLRTSTNNTV